MLARRMERWDPLNSLREEMGQLFDGLMGYMPGVSRFGAHPARAFPALNVWEDEQTLCAEAELPGVRMEDLEVLVAGDELTIKGDRKEEYIEKAEYHRRERGFGQFNRVLRLPVDIDANRVEASLRNGVLQLKLPKAEQAKARKVAVKTG